MATDAPTPRAQKIVIAAIAIAAALLLLEALLSFRAHRPTLLAAAPLLPSALLFAALWLPPARRRLIAMVVIPLIVLLFILEARLGARSPRPGTVAARRGQTFDTRSAWDVVHDERRGGADAYPSIEPRAVLARGGVDVDGVKVIPLGGLAEKKTVFCNEGGTYAIYESDERGFNNPKGIWTGARGTVEVGVVGDAFMQSACVPRAAGPVEIIRRRYPATVNLAVSGDGPLLQLASVMEYLSELRPKNVVWSYYHSDLAALEAEKASPILRRYVDGGFYKQGLTGRIDGIAKALGEVAQEEEKSASVWPGALGAVGLTRARTPMWIQDLVMGEQHASAGAALRLDKLNGFVAARLGPKQAEAPPDFDLFKRILEKAKATVASWGGTLTFVYLADLHNLRGPEHPTRARVLETVSAVGLPIVDLQPVFAAAPDPMVLRYHEESHCNEAGYHHIGQAILAAIAGRR